MIGHLARHEQRTDGEVYPSEYKYILAGALIEQKYPSGRVVKNVLDANGDISMIQSKRNVNFGFHNYAKHFTYNAAGAITSMQLGNGLWETAQFNSRLQSTQLGLGTLSTGANLWKVDYEFGELQTNGTVDTVKNSGNIARQTLTVPGTSFVQSYTYDSLYRLAEAVEKTGTTTNWSQQFGYDRYGNRTSLAQDISGIAKNTTPAVDANTNRFTSTDFGYDANGNIVEDIDEITSLPREFIFNGDNKQTEVKRDGITIGRYYYDGEGRRVKKVTDTETTVFVYAAGQLIAEYSTAISQTPSVSYTTSDHLGSPRVITNELGQVSSRRDFMPFGEELYAGIGNRTGDTGLKYSSADDHIRQKFTGYQKDNETGLDFAEARMYANSFGRFTAVDPLLASGKSADPQTFNRYVYVMNRPLRMVDPTGLVAGDYYDLKGRYLGSDDKDDEMAYVVYDDAKNKKLEDRASIAIPHAALVVPEIVASVDRSNKPSGDDKKGKFHEEAVTVDTVDGKPDMRTPSGPYAPDPSKGAHVNQTINESTVLKSHVHPAGSVTEYIDDQSTSSGGGRNVLGGTTRRASQFEQKPSPTDIQNALPNGTNIVVGARNKTVYFYASTGNKMGEKECNCIAQMSLDAFKKIGKR